jgi:hypothetical protein
MAAGHPHTSVTDRTPQMLICIYYRVAPAHSQQVISAVREFQRTLRESGRADAVEVLLRFEPSLPESPATPPDARPDSVPTPAPADAGADATVMETYRLALPPGALADDALRGFLAALETASAPLAGLLRGARHVELFVPCAS